MNEPLVSIIVATKDNARTIEKCISSLLSVECDSAEIIVVNDGSADSTKELLLKFIQRVRIIENSSSLGPSQARNMAVHEAKGEYVAFTDADCITDRYWAKELLRGFEVFPDAVSCGGAQLLPEDATSFEKKVFLLMKKAGFISEYMRNSDKSGITEVGHNASCNVMYRRDGFLQMQGFLKGLWPGEDVELDYRLRKAGKKIIYNPKAVVFHYRPRHLAAFLKMMLRYGWAQGILVRRYGFFRKIQVLPFLAPLCSAILIAAIFHLSSLWFPILFLCFVILAYLKFDFTLMLLSVSGFVAWNLGFLKSFLMISKSNHPFKKFIRK
jgi:glycosyltransferase involved in cell wall biosynthesis